jgi:hypothetical protein
VLMLLDLRGHQIERRRELADLVFRLERHARAVVAMRDSRLRSAW